MVGTGRLIKTIFLILGIYIIAVNIILWANNNEHSIFMNTSEIVSHNSYQYFHEQGESFKGFYWFFERIGSFPGLEQSYSAVLKYKQIITGASDLHPLFGTLAILNSPIELVVRFLQDFISIVIWFFEFVYYAI